MYALLIQDVADRDRLDRFLDDPLPRDLTLEEQRLADARRVADANRTAVAALEQAARLPTAGR